MQTKPQTCHESQGRRYPSRSDQHRSHLAFPPRSRLGPDGEGHQRADVSKRGARDEQRRVQVLDSPGRVKTAQGRKAAGRRIAENLPKWKNWKLKRAALKSRRACGSSTLWPHARPFGVPRHLRQRPAHTSNDTMYVPESCLLTRIGRAHTIRMDHWRVTSRHRIIDRVIADKMQICGVIFRSPAQGRLCTTAELTRSPRSFKPERPIPTVSILSIHQRRKCHVQLQEYSRTRDRRQPCSRVATDPPIGARRRQYGDERRYRSHFGARQDQGAGLQGVLAELRDLAEDNQNADVYIARASPSRKTGDYTTSLSYYTKALGPAAGPQGRSRVSWRALGRDRPYGQGEGAACCAGEALSRGLRRTRGSRKAIADKKAASN